MTKHFRFGEFLQEVRRAQTPDMCNVRAAAPTTAGSERIGADGGFAASPEMGTEIMRLVRENSLVGLCSQVTIARGSLLVPVDEGQPGAAAGVVWESELAALAASKMALSAKVFNLCKITALVPVSEELLEDAPGLDAYMRVALPEKLGAKLSYAVIRGTGVGMPMGILNSPALITVTRSGTSVAADAAKAWRRLHESGRQNAVWLVHADVDMPTAPGFPLLLHGRPVIAAAGCSAPGTAGDIILADLSQYLLVMRRLKLDVSMHFYFDDAAMAFRVIWRVDGACLWASAKAPLHGSDRLSAIVTLATAG